MATATATDGTDGMAEMALDNGGMVAVMENGIHTGTGWHRNG